jgi:hypothetical protein
VLVTGEEDPIDGPVGAFQAGRRVGAGEDHDITSRNPDHQLARNRALDVVPEVVDQQHARFKAVEGQHQRGRLAMNPEAGQPLIEVSQRRAAQIAPRDVHPIQFGPGDQAFVVWRPEGVRHGDAVVELVKDVLAIDARVADRHQQRQ